jgi:putative Mn2+ efflux pump MntP
LVWPPHAAGLGGTGAGEARRTRPGAGLGALLLGVSISLDELAIGFTLDLLRLPAGLIIALPAFILAQLGLRLGTRLSAQPREAAERLAGIALTALAITLDCLRISPAARSRRGSSSAQS